MYVCMNTYIYIYIYSVCIYTYIYEYIYIYVYIHIYITIYESDLFGEGDSAQLQERNLWGGHSHQDEAKREGGGWFRPQHAG